MVKAVATGRTEIAQDAFDWEFPGTRTAVFTVFVRPVGGGCEWTAFPEDVRRSGKEAGRHLDAVIATLVRR
ncbi:hypothetical protein [Streptomyces sp. NPDC003077]|uniref:hypothetical protein n=1 Tax=Streptomyces sp. NPDC003077 TaxID=3154443 RepID=UPI0033A5DD0C